MPRVTTKDLVALFLQLSGKCVPLNTRPPHQLARSIQCYRKRLNHLCRHQRESSDSFHTAQADPGGCNIPQPRVSNSTFNTAASAGGRVLLPPAHRALGAARPTLLLPSRLLFLQAPGFSHPTACAHHGSWPWHLPEHRPSWNLCPFHCHRFVQCHVPLIQEMQNIAIDSRA